jgi:hypothetical protein
LDAKHRSKFSVDKEDRQDEGNVPKFIAAHSLRDGLTRGDIGTVVLVHKEGKGYEVEFTTLDGETIAIVTLTANQVRLSKARDIAHVRDLATNP